LNFFIPPKYWGSLEGRLTLTWGNLRGRSPLFLLPPLPLGKGKGIQGIGLYKLLKERKNLFLKGLCPLNPPLYNLENLGIKSKHIDGKGE